MISFIEIRCDISGLSKRYSGEATVAKYGRKHSLLSKESQATRTIIKRECKNKTHNLSLFTLTSDTKNNNFLIIKKSPHRSDFKSANGASCTHIIIGFNSLDNLKKFIISRLFSYYFFEIDINKLILFYLENGKSYDLDEDKFDAVKPQPIERNIEYQSIDKGSLIATSKKSHVIPLIFMLILKEKSFFSILYIKSNDDDIFTGFNQEDLYVTKNESLHIYSNIRNLITVEENINIIKSLNLIEAQDFLINVNKSIEMNLKTIEVLSNTSSNKNSLLDTLTKKKITSSKVEKTISNAADNIESLMKIQKKFLESMESQINLK